MTTPISTFSTFSKKCFLLIIIIDIDECGVGTNNCTEICNNTDGGFFCSCKDGYQIASDNRTCEGTYTVRI